MEKHQTQRTTLPLIFVSMINGEIREPPPIFDPRIPLFGLIILFSKYRQLAISRAEWKIDGAMQGYETVLFIDGLKMFSRAAAGVLSNTHSVSKSYGRPGFVSVFPAEVLVIPEAYRFGV